MNAAPPRPTSRRRLPRLIVVVAAVAGILALGYAAIGLYAYQDQSTVRRSCLATGFGGQTPANFEAHDEAVPPAHVVDTGPYRFADFQSVEFPARGASLTIRGWYAPGPKAVAGPVVIVIHGKGSCRRDSKVLLPAGMLHRSGFGVLLVDLRNHGDSDSDNGHWAGGDKEFNDVLGAWDWLVAQGHDPRTIGLLGTSLGAATGTIAMGEEPRVAATWADSSYADFGTAIGEFAEENGYPSWIVGSAVPMGRIVGDPELGGRSPDDEVRKLNGRPFFIVQGLNDQTIRPHHALDLAVAALDGGTRVDPWIVPGAGHVEAMLFEPARYEQKLVEFFESALGTP